MADKLEPFDPIAFLETDEDVAEYLTACAEQGDQYFFAALSDIARAHGMSKLADETGLERRGLYNALREDATGTRWTTVLKVLDAIGYTIEFRKKAS